MSFTYDPTTDFGKVRLLCQDFDSVNAIFQDTEIQAFMDLNIGSVRLAAAQALDVIAASEVYVQKRIKSLDIETDGPREALALKELSAELRRQEYEGSGDMTGFFDWAEMVYNDWTQRERLINQALRQQST